MIGKRVWPWLLVLGCGLALSLSLIYADYRHFLEMPLSVPAQGLVLDIKPGTGISHLARQLHEQSAMSRPPLYLETYARLNGLASRLKAGEYALTADLTPLLLLDRIVAGRVIQYSLTVVEGWTFRQLRQALVAHPKLVQTLSGLSDTEVMARLNRPGDHPEGRFLPDTYHFPTGFTDEAFLQRALTAMDQRLAEIWNQRAPDVPLQNADQALILASIIEKETGVAAERAEIAGVFTRRLRQGMRLQTDPTVIYGLGEAFDGNLRRRDLETDTPYNTYTRSGLPPTPIALPGMAALEAAVNPAPGDTLYFVADGQGGHVFSRTLEEHNRAVRRYQLKKPSLPQVSPD
ncbi:MAG: hypothetical protein QG599_3356 [Pseudomonadota bacterium]|nr:hypothetical protein [Pseudomonadota bacterium]